jgi:23S rRNA (cytidine2498-2'-O)-methyltransferase
LVLHGADRGVSGIVGYLAPDGFLDQLLVEVGDALVETYGRLVLARRRAREPAWVANVWQEPRRLAIASIGDAASQLRGLQRNWAHYPHAFHRRAALIAERLPKVSAKPIAFGEPAPTAPLGSWTLLDQDNVLASTRCSSPFVNGEPVFIEDREGPPNRAYLKLWEALTLLPVRPVPGETCLDLGASPGGWAFVLAGLGARVISVDKAPLDPRVCALPGVEHRQTSAFGLDPAAIGPVDWLFSDVICYPDRLLALVERWLAAGTAKRFVCSVKFQGATDFATQARFAAIPGSRLLHLHHNKHELTWIKL